MFKSSSANQKWFRWTTSNYKAPYSLLQTHCPESPCRPLYDQFRRRKLCNSSGSRKFNNQLNKFCRAVIFFGSISAIHAVTENHRLEKILSQIKLALNLLKSMQKIIVIRWISSHVGIDNNEHPNSLTKFGAHTQHDITPVKTLFQKT